MKVSEASAILDARRAEICDAYYFSRRTDADRREMEEALDMLEVMADNFVRYGKAAASRDAAIAARRAEFKAR